MQRPFPESKKFFCDPDGAGSRSKTVPTSVHELRPGDIDIVAAIGDSLTAGNGALATNILQVFIENKGVSWSIGGRGSWHKYLTVCTSPPAIVPKNHLSQKKKILRLITHSNDVAFLIRLLFNIYLTKFMFCFVSLFFFNCCSFQTFLRCTIQTCTDIHCQMDFQYTSPQGESRFVSAPDRTDYYDNGPMQLISFCVSFFHRLTVFFYRIFCFQV